jgi:hypothetical protein
MKFHIDLIFIFFQYKPKVPMMLNEMLTQYEN